jgi:hypothetical protein
MIVLQKFRDILFKRGCSWFAHIPLPWLSARLSSFFHPKLDGLHLDPVEYDNTFRSFYLERSMRILEEMVMADGLFKK